MKKPHKILVGKPEGMRDLGRSGRRRWIYMKWILRNLSGKVWIGFIWLRMGICDGLL
jgi:hypothetical protein